MFSALFNWLFGQIQASAVVKLSDIRTHAQLFAEHGPDLVDEQVPGEPGETYTVDTELNSKVSLIYGDITRLEVDGIVRSTDQTLLSAQGISGVILKAAGAKLTEELRILRQCDPGKAVTTGPGGYLLPAKYIVHTVGRRTPELLESCYTECYKQMLEKEMRSLAFCCISAGKGGYPSDGAATVALRTIRKSLEQLKGEENLQRVDRIVFCVFSITDLLLYKQWMQFFFPCPPVQVVRDIAYPAYPAYDPVERILQPFGGIELTREPCMMTEENDPQTMRARMPCGHVIAPKWMAHYCKEEVKKEKSKFVCPILNCKAEWPYYLVRHVACLTAEEMGQVEPRMARAIFDRKKDYKRCPGCGTFCYRPPGTRNCVRCPTCSTGGRRYDFCWICLKKWKGLTPYFSCGNPQCGRKDDIQTLATCMTKRIDFCNDCPAIRGCPKCGRLIEHSSRCGYVECPKCPDFGFCFICLTGREEGKWKCWPFFGTCKLAPRQTQLP